MQVEEVLAEMVEKQATDIYCIAGRPLSFKLDGVITPYDDHILSPSRTEDFVRQVFELADQRPMDRLYLVGDDDFSLSIKGVSRFRANVYRQRGTLAAVIRVIPFDLPDAAALNIPEFIDGLAQLRYGLVLVTGPAGSGKSTTLATIIDRINTTRNSHIITLENPIEFLHRHQMSLVSQREIEIDSESYASALKAAMRQSPDVILIGELRDPETISIAITAAETGHLVLSTVHTLGAANAVDRLIHSYSASQQEQVRMQLSMVLASVISQQLLKKTDGGIIPAFEVMHSNNAARNLIREGRTHQLGQVIDSSSAEGMMSMDSSLLRLYQQGQIDATEMLLHAMSPDSLSRLAGLG